MTIAIDGRFDFSLQREFRELYEDSTEQVNTYIVDLSKTTYLDSSALGMLLVLKEFSDENKRAISISNPTKTVKEILELSNFSKLFKIS